MQPRLTHSAALVALAGLLGLTCWKLKAETNVRRCSAASVASASAPKTSVACLSCHDGSMASNVSPVDPSFPASGGQRDHPMLISYSDAYLRKPTAYVPPALLDSRVKLEAGKIGCLTCHSLSSREAAMLVLPDRRNGLCVSCHRM